MPNTIGILAATLVAMLGMTAPVAGAQPPSPTPQPPKDAAAEALEDALLGPSEACHAFYRLGSVEFSFPDDTSERYRAGDVLQLRGTLQNKNSYPLRNGQVIVQVLREESDEIAARNWHSLVEEQILPEDLSLSAKATRDFSFSWRIPARAPAGDYRLAFFYQTDGRFSISGLPYVTNAPGGTFLFTVEGRRAQASVLAFDRAQVRLNGKPVAFREAAPTIAVGTPVTVEGILSTLGGEEGARVTFAAYRWDSTEGSPPKPLAEETRAVSLDEGERAPMSYTWTPPGPGTYALLARAEPTDRGILPSLVKVRFSVPGFVPRLLFAGETGSAPGKQGFATTCVANATSPVTGATESGKVELTVRGDGQVVAEQSAAIGGLLVAGASTPVNLDRPLILEAVARDSRGEVVDRFTSAIGAAPLTRPSASPDLRRVFAAVLITAAAVVVTLWFLFRAHRSRHA